MSFIQANDIDGLLSGINKKSFDYFLWEKFTTKPYVDSALVEKVNR